MAGFLDLGTGYWLNTDAIEWMHEMPDSVMVRMTSGHEWLYSGEQARRIKNATGVRLYHEMAERRGGN